MKADIMGQAGLWGWAVAGLLIFAGAFVAQAWWTFAARNRQIFDRAAHLPLDDGDISPPPHPVSGQE